MTSRPYHNAESFTRAVEQLIERADREGRGDDLDRLVSRLERTPREVTPLSSFVMMLDEDWRVLVRDEVEALRRWGKQRGKAVEDNEIMALMMKAYNTRRGRSAGEPAKGGSGGKR